MILRFIDVYKRQSQLLAALREQDLPELAAEIAPDWDLPTEAVQSGLETLRSHLELVQDDAALPVSYTHLSAESFSSSAHCQRHLAGLWTYHG